MALRLTTAVFLSTDMTVTAWEINLTLTNGSDQVFHLYYIGIINLKLLIPIMNLVGLAGNAVVLWLLAFRMHSNAFSVYILNLAGADFLFLCYQFMYMLALFFNFSFSHGVQNRFVIIVSVFAYISGLSFLSVISTERCMSVLWPIWYHCRRSRHMSAVMCALLWALSLLLSMLDRHSSILQLNFLNPYVYHVFDFIMVSWLILLFVLLSGTSLALITRLLCSSHGVPPTRLYVTLMFTVLVFLLCGLPFGILRILFFKIPNQSNDLFYLYMMAVLLSSVNSCANPIIYFFVGSFRQRWWKRRHTLRLVLQRALQDTPEADEPGESLPGETLAMSGGSLGQG